MDISQLILFLVYNFNLFNLLDNQSHIINLKKTLKKVLYKKKEVLLLQPQIRQVLIITDDKKGLKKFQKKLKIIFVYRKKVITFAVPKGDKVSSKKY